MQSRSQLSLTPTTKIKKSKFRQDHIEDSHRRIGLETSVRTPEFTKRSGARRPSRHLVSVPDTRGSTTRTDQNEGCLRISRLRPFARTRGPTQTYDRTEKPNLSPKEMV